MMNFVDLIEKKRDGIDLTEAEIKYIVESYVTRHTPDYQMAALLMAIYLKGMSYEENLWFTNAMLDSGERINLEMIPGIKVDKHSTGGVGDKVSLILAPMVAALGVSIPMISGRGLAHSGGTLDKLEAIPGFNTHLSASEFIREIKDLGVALIGQTDTIVPADKKIYALRDATATVNSIPLVTASIMSKKIAEGINALVLDVKVGKGAFFQTMDQAQELVGRLISIGNRHHLNTVALLTAMDQPLGLAVGNWLETNEAINALQGKGPRDLMTVTYALGALMLVAAQKVPSIAAGIEQCQQVIASGAAFDKFIQIVHWQGGDVNLIYHPENYPQSRFSLTIKSRQSGYVQELDALSIGRIAMKLGAGRFRKEDQIDFSAGIVLHKKQGDWVDTGDVLAIAYSNTKEALLETKPRIGQVFVLAESKPSATPLILKMVDARGSHDWSYPIL